MAKKKKAKKRKAKKAVKRKKKNPAMKPRKRPLAKATKKARRKKVAKALKSNKVPKAPKGYKLWNQVLYKRMADQVADRLRKEGNLARVVKGYDPKIFSGEGHDVYTVFYKRASRPPKPVPVKFNPEKYKRTRIADPREFDSRSFRVKNVPGKSHKLVVACPIGSWDAKTGRCKAGMEVQSVLTEKKPRGKNPLLMVVPNKKKAKKAKKKPKRKNPLLMVVPNKGKKKEKNPPKGWHEKQRREYAKRMAEDLKAEHGKGADYWQGATSAEARAVAANAPRIRKLMAIKKRGKAGMVDGRKVSAPLASAIVKCYAQLDAAGKRTFGKAPLDRMVAVVQRLHGRGVLK